MTKLQLSAETDATIFENNYLLITATNVNKLFKDIIDFIPTSGSSASGNFLPLSGGTLSGTTNFSNGALIQSGGTDLYDIFATSAGSSDITRVQPGSNILTGGTDNFPTVNLVSTPSVNGFIASGSSSFQILSATTIYSGSTNINSLFADKIHSHSQYATLSGANFTGFIQSGGTDLYSIFSTTDNNDITRVQSGLNTYTGGTNNLPSVNISAATLSYLSASTLSGGTIYSGSTDLYSIFNTKQTTFSSIVDASVSGTTLETLMQSFLIPANTVSPGKFIYYDAMFRKVGTAGLLTPKVRIHTSNALAGNVVYNAQAISIATNGGGITKHLTVKSSTNTESSSSSVNDWTASQLALTSFNINWAIDQYFIFSLTMGNSGDTGTISNYFVTIK